MAEVLKKKTEDKYNTESIKKEIEKKEKNKDKNKKNNPKKVEKKTSNKKGIFSKIKEFFDSVGVEFKRVHWPSKKDMVKYSIATIIFILFFGAFFYIIDVIFAFIQTLF